MKPDWLTRKMSQQSDRTASLIMFTLMLIALICLAAMYVWVKVNTSI